VTLTVSGLRDVSMEENELYRYSEVVIAGAQAQESAPSAAPAAETLRDEPLLDVKTLVFFGAAGLLLAAGAAALVVRSVRGNAGKKRRPEKEKEDKKKPREKEEKPTATFMFDRKP
jgi:ribosomal protein L12E/L44/L45/RPP1/RPP2